MKLVIRSVALWGHPNLRTWEPDDPADMAEEMLVDVGPKLKAGADTFRIRVATPAGLQRLEARDGVIAAGPLLIMERYDFDSFWNWLERTVRSCEAETWPACVEKLRRHFGWEFEECERNG